ncbi:hypothetical protein AB3U99_11660 [Niallia sp. JL1B1071]|uniref:hypothetical protein n=1 Tax=Niallia tiangongensis TaxID=3237105 RepID=UPI0037DD2109
MKRYLQEKRGITELESITVHDLKAYIRSKQLDGLQAQSIVSMFKMTRAFFFRFESERYVEKIA